MKYIYPSVCIGMYTCVYALCLQIHELKFWVDFLNVQDQQADPYRIQRLEAATQFH